MANDVLLTSVNLRLEVADIGDFEVVDCQLNYGLTEIPSATVTLAVGRNALNTSQKAKIHESASKLTSMLTAKIYATIKGQFSKDAAWPEDETVVFEGRVAGTGFNRLLGQANYQLHLIHWLADLSFSSTLSQQSHPGNPSKYTFGAVRSTGKSGAKDSTMLGSMVGSPKTLFTARNIEEDLWAKSIHPTLCLIAEQDLIDISGDLRHISEKNKTNDLAKAALSRFEGGDCGKKPSDYTPPLSLLNDGAITQNIVDAIRNVIGGFTTQAWAQSTMWDLLAGPMAQSFMFGVVPQAEKALVVPTLPGFSQTYEIGIDADDYDFAQLSGAIPRPLRGVGVFGGIQSNTGPMVGGTTRIGGFWPKEGDLDEIPDGMIKLISAPAWIANIPMGRSAPRDTSGTANQQITNTATTPTEEDTKPDSEGQAETKSARTIEAARFADRYAHAMYVNEVLRGKNGSISGKLRFDIAPGSTIRIEGKRESFIGSEDQLGEDLYGMVTKVSIGLNAENAKAGTGFIISSVRDEADKDNPRFTTEKHPLYGKAFKGAPIVDAYKVT